MEIRRYGDRYWSIYDNDGTLICVTVYKKGAKEVFNRLSGMETEPHIQKAINIDELKNLKKELKQLNRKFNAMFN